MGIDLDTSPPETSERTRSRVVRARAAGSSVAGLYAELVFARRWLIAGMAILGAVIGFAVTQFQPAPYEARAVVLPEGGSQPASLLSTNSIPGLPISMGNAAPPFTTFHRNILESDALARRVAARLELPLRGERRPEMTGWDELLTASTARIRGSIRVVENRDRLLWGSKAAIVLYARDRNPVMAADIANTYVHELDRFIRDTSGSAASRLRRFVERRLRETNAELERNQARLQAFQESHGTVAVEEQAKATMEVLSQLEAERVATLVTLEAEKEVHSAAHSGVRSLQARLDALNRSIETLGSSTDASVGVEQNGQVEFYVPLKRIPSLTFDASRLVLDVATQTEVVGLLTKQLEEAKLEEEKNLPLVTVLDEANPPERRMGRRTLASATFGGTVGVFAGILIAFGLYFVDGTLKTEEAGRIRRIFTDALRRDRDRVLAVAHRLPIVSRLSLRRRRARRH